MTPLPLRGASSLGDRDISPRSFDRRLPVISGKKIAKKACSGRQAFWAVTVVFLAGCVGQPDGDSDMWSSEVAAEGSTLGHDGTVRGILVMGPEVRTFKPCAENTELWAIPVESVLRAYDALTSEAYEPLFVEVEGGREVAPASGPAAGHSGQIRLANLLRAEPVGQGLGCGESLVSVAFRASGHEPFWHVRVLSDRITLASREIPSTIFREGLPIPLDNGWRFEAESVGPETVSLRLDLIRGSCLDPTSGSLYTWTALLDVGGFVRSGCAWEGELAPGRATN